MNPDETFDDILRKASEIKTAQMKDKRRAWEASPEFMKNTMTFDKDESYVAMRKSASVAEKIAFAAPIKEEGNELFAKGKYAQAMAKYTAAVAVFRYWNREQSGREQNVVKYYDDEAVEDPDDRRAARNLIRSIYLNAAQCMRKGNLADGPTEIIWTCTEVLAIDPSSAKAHYVRALARAELDDSASLELAVKDLARANALAPKDRAVRDAMRTYGAAHAEQTAKDRAAYGAVFGSRNKEGLYANEEEPETRERAAASAGAGASGEGSDGDADPALRALQNMSEEELKARCKAVGVDLDNPRVVKELGKRAKARKEEELKAKAREMGIDLGDPSVRKMLELLEKEERGAEELSRLPAWRRWIYHSFDGTRWLNVQNAMYAALAVSREELSPRFFRFLLQKVQRCVVLTSRFPPTQVNVVYRVWKVINMPEVSPRGFGGYPGDDEF